MSDLTEAQRAAVAGLCAFAREAQPGAVFVLRGYAGTGKTFTLRHMIDAVGESVVLCPTGKAALRAYELTGSIARTIHSWLYTPAGADRRTGEPRWTVKPSEWLDAPPSRVLFVDEASMVRRDVWQDLREAAVRVEARVVLIGDGFQLAPIGDDAFSLMADAQYCAVRFDLTDVMRQDEGPVLRAATAIRSGARASQTLRVALPYVRSVAELAAISARGWAVLCWRNRTRCALNDQIRRLLGRTGEAQAGEPLLVVHNAYDFSGASGGGLFNGERTVLAGWERAPDGEYYEGTDDAVDDSPQIRVRFGVAQIDGERAAVCPEEIDGSADVPFARRGLRNSLRRAVAQAARAWVVSVADGPARWVIVPALLRAGTVLGLDAVALARATIDVVRRAARAAVFAVHPDRGGSHAATLAALAARDLLMGAINARRLWAQSNSLRCVAPLLHVNFGYAMTVHKAQGSEWDEVVIVDEPGALDDPRWAYTAVTRARRCAWIYRP